MRNHPFRYTLQTTAVCSLVFLAACPAPNPAPVGLEELSSVTVLVRGNLAYPISQFRCSDAEDAGSDETCPNGFGCDARHYHGSALAIGTLGANGAADATVVDFSVTSATEDPDQCLCGWGKVTEVDIRTISISKTGVDSFSGASFLAPVEDLTTAEQLSVDPCGG